MSQALSFLTRNNAPYAFVTLMTLVVCAYALSQAINALLAWQVQDSIKQNAETTSVTWSQKFFETTPAARQIVESGDVPLGDVRKVEDSFALSEVIRFKTFDRNGVLTFISDTRLLESAKDLNEKAEKVFQSGEPMIFVKDNDGERINYPETYVETYIPAVTPDGEMVGVIEVYVDVTALKHALTEAFQRISGILVLGTTLVLMIPAFGFAHKSRLSRMKDRKLLELTRYDQLTGVLNRNSLAKVLSSLFDGKNRPRSIGMMFVDLDYFKQVNDRFGHQCGDALLRHVAKALKEVIRTDTDTVARYGGDEFLLLFPNATDEALNKIYERIRARLDQPFHYEGRRIQLSLSIGAHVTNWEDTTRTALHKADVAVYAAKHRGRNQLVHYSPHLVQMFEEQQQRNKQRRETGKDVSRTAKAITS